MTPRTVLFQPPNRIGLGHMSRLIAIALELRRVAPDVRTPFVVEGSSHGLIDAYGLPEICLPSSFDLYDTTKWNAWDRASRQVLMCDVARALLGSLTPDLVVFDCFPNGALANAALERDIPAVICLRKIKGMPLFFDCLRDRASCIQLVLIPHEEGACDVPADLRSRVRFTGTIGRPAPPGEDLPRARPDARLVVISAGGGGYPGTVDFYNLALDAFTRLRARVPDLDALLVAGPLFKDWPRLRLVEGVRVLPFDPRLSSAFATADLVVCQAGYNTIAEVAASAVPALVVPAARKSDDQFERAHAAARSSPTLAVYERDDPEEFAGLMLRALAQPRRDHDRSRALAPAGAARAVEELLALLSGQRTTTPRSTPS